VGFCLAAERGEVTGNVRRYGNLSVCTFHPGWFRDTLGGRSLPPVRLVYIDCDTPNGTRDVLASVVPALTSEGVIYSQDYHLEDVRRMLHEPGTWTSLGVAAPLIQHVARNLGRIAWVTR
jgi:hypothetical protein